MRSLRYLEKDKAKMALAFVCVIGYNTVCMLAGSYMLRPIINTYRRWNGSRGDIQGLGQGADCSGIRVPGRSGGKLLSGQA